MGFFKRTKEEPVYNLPEELAGGFIQPLSQKLVRVDIGSKLKVQKGWNAIIVAKDKPLDVFEGGDHKLSIPNIPKATAKLGLDKSRVIRRRGRPEIVFPKGFMCDIYFVNMGEFRDQQWQTKNLSLKDKKFGRFFAQLSGTYAFQCENTTRALHLFLLERGFIKVGYAQRRLQSYVNEFVADMLKAMRPASPEIISDKVKMSSLIQTHLNEIFKKYGITITDLDVCGVDFDKHVASLLGDSRAKRLELDDDANYNTNTDDILKNVDFDDELVIVGATQRQKEREAFVKEQQRLSLKHETNQSSQSTIKRTSTQRIELPPKKREVKSIEYDEGPKVRRCPKCGKICKDTDIICDCGCNLD